MSRHPRAAVTALRADFLDVIGFDNPMAALNAIEDDTRIRVLITRVAFGPGKLNGVALARMVRVKRPGTKVVFVARTEHPIRRGSGIPAAAVLCRSSRRDGYTPVRGAGLTSRTLSDGPGAPTGVVLWSRRGGRFSAGLPFDADANASLP